MTTGRILFKEQSFRIIGTCFEVYKENRARTIRQPATSAYFVVSVSSELISPHYVLVSCDTGS